MKFHPYSKYKIKNILAKELTQGSYSKSFDFFSQADLALLQDNLKGYNALFK